MADNYIANSGAGGKTFASDQVSGIDYPRIKITTGADGAADGDVSTALPMPTRRYETASAKSTHATQATVAAGGQATLDSAQISSGKTGKLLGLLVSSSVPFKAQVQTVSNGVASGNLVVWFAMSGGWDWKTPDRDFITVAQDAGAGSDLLRVVITNLDTSQAVDVYATFFYDEETT